MRGSGDARFDSVVWGERDEFRDHEAVRPNTAFTPESLERSGALATYPASTKALLVRNGTLNEDGTYNRTTPDRLDWALPEPRVTAGPPDDQSQLGKK